MPFKILLPVTHRLFKLVLSPPVIRLPLLAAATLLTVRLNPAPANVELVLTVVAFMVMFEPKVSVAL